MNSKTILSALLSERVSNVKALRVEGISDVELAAARFALMAHEGQTRKVTGEPYVNHCGAVADILRSWDYGDEQLAAAWLHDVIEDTRFDFAHILMTFGPDVAMLVLGMTSASKLCCPKATRADRKRVDRVVMSSQPMRVKVIKIADIIHNAKTIAGCGKEFALMWFREAVDMLDVLGINNAMSNGCRALIAEEVMKINAGEG